MSGTPTPSASSLERMTGTAWAAASLLTVMRTSSEPACASCATWMAVASASAVSVFVIDCTTTGWADPTGTPPTSTVGVVRRGGTLIGDHGRARPSDRHTACTGRDVTEGVATSRGPGRVWIVEDEPASATLAAELCEALFLATRHRYPRLPVIYWTGHSSDALPAMITDDAHTTVVDKAGGTKPFERALDWAARVGSEEPAR